MKALVKYAKGPGNLEIREVEEPKVSGDLVKIRVVYAGICGSDLHTWAGEYASNKPPVTLGHEFSGIVEEVGPDVKELKVGDRVTSETTFKTCGKCIYCKNEEYNLCSSRQGLGTQADGGFAEYVINHEARIHKLPEKVSLLQASLTEPLACCVHGAMETSQVKPGETVLIFGPGAMGLLTGMVCKSQGAKVVIAGLTKDEKRFEVARTLGFDRIVDQMKEDLGTVMNEMTDGIGPDKIYECSGALPALNRSFELIRKKGEVVQIGVFAKDINEVNVGIFFPKEIHYMGTRTQKPSAWRTSLQLMAEGLVQPEKVVTMITDLDNWEEGFTKSKNAEEVKVVIQVADTDEK